MELINFYVTNSTQNEKEPKKNAILHNKLILTFLLHFDFIFITQEFDIMPCIKTAIIFYYITFTLSIE